MKLCIGPPPPQSMLTQMMSDAQQQEHFKRTMLKHLMLNKGVERKLIRYFQIVCDNCSMVSMCIPIN